MIPQTYVFNLRTLIVIHHAQNLNFEREREIKRKRERERESKKNPVLVT